MARTVSVGRTRPPAYPAGTDRPQTQAVHAEPTPRRGRIPQSTRGVPQGRGSVARSERRSGTGDGVEAAVDVAEAETTGTGLVASEFLQERMIESRPASALQTMFMTCTCGPSTRNAAPGNKSCTVYPCERLQALGAYPLRSSASLVRTRTGEPVQSACSYRTARVAPAPAVRSLDHREIAPEIRASG
jgi:hypothetical protein